MQLAQRQHQQDIAHLQQATTATPPQVQALRSEVGNELCAAHEQLSSLQAQVRALAATPTTPAQLAEIHARMAALETAFSSLFV